MLVKKRMQADFRNLSPMFEKYDILVTYLMFSTALEILLQQIDAKVLFFYERVVLKYLNAYC